MTSASGVHPLVELIEREQAPLLVRRFFGSGDGPVSPITASLAQVPELAEVALPFVGAALAPAILDGRLKEIAILRTSALLECRYCIQSHTPMALDSGLSPQEVRALRAEGPIESAFGDERDRAAIAWIDAVAAGRGPLDPAVRSLATGTFSDPELVELTLCVTATLMLNRYCTSLELPTSAATLARLATEGFA